MNKNSKVAIVTGSNGAIGRSVTEKLKSAGIQCVEVDLHGKVVCDFRKTREVRTVFNKLASKYKKIDYVLNISGVGIYKPIGTITYGDWIDSFNINLNTPFLISQILWRNMVLANKPLILNIGSGMGVFPVAGRLAYNTTKFGLRGFSLSLGLDLKQHGIDVSLLTLGSVMTPFGTGGLEKRRELLQKGKKYLTTSQVAAKILKIIQAKHRSTEYTLYPKGYP